MIDPNVSALAAALVAVVERVTEPAVVVLDGRSGAGKSTLAASVAASLGRRQDPISVTVIEGDLFYAGGSSATWDRRTVEERASQVIDWRRQRLVLEQLRGDGVSTWWPFDWNAEDWDADEVPLCTEAITTDAASIVILEGAYSARPELHDLVDLRVLLDTPPDVRRRRLLEREGDEYRADWESRWSGAEDHYFGSTMPPERFDLVLGAEPTQL